MNSVEFISQIKDVKLIIKFIELSCILISAYYIFMKINNENINNKDKIIFLASTPIIAIITGFIRINIRVYLSWLVAIFFMTIINRFIYKKETDFTILTTIISLSLSYIIYTSSVMILFLPNILFNIKNDYISLTMIILTYFFMIYRIFNLKKLKYGLSFLKERMENPYFSITVLIIGSIALFSLITLQSYVGLGAAKLGTVFAVISVIMFVVIKQLFSLYYKQSLLTKDLEQTKVELENKKKEITKLEKENLEFGKTSHSLAHKQKSLEHKLEKLMETGVDAKSKENIKREIQNISKEVYKEPQQIELPETEIEVIDDMFSYMQSECIKDNIRFELQIVGNLFYMINHLISESELEILLADHIKDAIIAINNSDNANRSILVRIGKIDNVYSLYIYDSGIEFEKEVIENLGKRPITTYADSGGTGMGFMNTFDTLNRTKASLIINEIGKPCIDNYTKVLIFNFDSKNKFIVNSYKNVVVEV